MYKVEAIGFVSSSVNEQRDIDWGDIVSSIDVDARYRAGLKGLDQFSHIIVLTYLNEANFDSKRHLVRRPRGLDTMPEVGIFSQRSKDRPNSIGVTAVRIVEVTDLSIRVQGLDAINRTPVLDIKPYFPHYDSVDIAVVPSWVEELMKDYF